MTKSPSAFFHDTLPSWLSIGNVPAATLNDKKNQNLKHYGLPNVIILHFAHLLFIYLPIFFSLRYIDPLIKYKSVHSDIVHMTVFFVYAGAVVPFAALMWIFRAKCNRWLMLNQPPLQAQRLLMHEDIGAGLQDELKESQNTENDELHGDLKVQQKHRDPRFVCPVRPDQSFMVEQKPLIQQFNKNRRKKEA